MGTVGVPKRGSSPNRDGNERLQSLCLASSESRAAEATPAPAAATTAAPGPAAGSARGAAPPGTAREAPPPYCVRTTSVRGLKLSPSGRGRYPRRGTLGVCWGGGNSYTPALIKPRQALYH